MRQSTRNKDRAEPGHNQCKKPSEERCQGITPLVTHYSYTDSQQITEQRPAERRDARNQNGTLNQSRGSSTCISADVAGVQMGVGAPAPGALAAAAGDRTARRGLRSGFTGLPVFGSSTNITASSSESGSAVSISTSSPAVVATSSSSSSARPRFLGDGMRDMGPRVGEENISVSVSFAERKSVALWLGVVHGFTGEECGVGVTDASRCVAYPSYTPSILSALEARSVPSP